MTKQANAVLNPPEDPKPKRTGREMLGSAGRYTAAIGGLAVVSAAVLGAIVAGVEGVEALLPKDAKAVGNVHNQENKVTNPAAMLAGKLRGNPKAVEIAETIQQQIADMVETGAADLVADYEAEQAGDSTSPNKPVITRGPDGPSGHTYTLTEGNMTVTFAATDGGHGSDFRADSVTSFRINLGGQTQQNPPDMEIFKYDAGIWSYSEANGATTEDDDPVAVPVFGSDTPTPTIDALRDQALVIASITGH